MTGLSVQYSTHILASSKQRWCHTDLTLGPGRGSHSSSAGWPVSACSAEHTSWQPQAEMTAQCAVYLCVQTMVWLPVSGIFNVHTDVDAGNWCGGCMNTIESALKVTLGEKILHQYCRCFPVRHSINCIKPTVCTWDLHKKWSFSLCICQPLTEVFLIYSQLVYSPVNKQWF